MFVSPTARLINFETQMKLWPVFIFSLIGFNYFLNILFQMQSEATSTSACNSTSFKMQYCSTVQLRQNIYDQDSWWRRDVPCQKMYWRKMYSFPLRKKYFFLQQMLSENSGIPIFSWETYSNLRFYIRKVLRLDQKMLTFHNDIYGHTTNAWENGPMGHFNFIQEGIGRTIILTKWTFLTSSHTRIGVST